MAIYHLSQRFISRSGGRSSVQSAAYISGEKLYEERREIIADYTKRKGDVICVETLAPEKSKYKDINVWNKVEKFEDEYAEKYYKTEETIANYKECAQTATTIVLALPNELSIEKNKELLEEFINTRFTSRGLISTYAIHNNEGNLHAHIQTTRRAINEESGEFEGRKDRAICTKSALIETRKLWADLANEYLEKEGILERINEKSFVDLGIDLLPTKHRGWYGDAIGDKSRIVNENKETEQTNVEKIIENPSVIIDLLNSKKALFTQKDILRELGKRLGDENQISGVFEKILEEAEYVGEGVKGELLYTGKKYRELESDTLSKFDKLIDSKIEKADKNTKVENTDNNNVDANDRNRENLKKQEGIREYILRENGEYSYLSEEQKKAVIGLAGTEQISILVGKAGAGKTSTMEAVAEIYKNQGSRVIGMSLSAVASENLGNDAKIESMTIAKWAHNWRSYEIAKEKFLSFNEIIDHGILKQVDWYNDLKRYEGSQLKKGDVIIVDEAGMVGTENWNEILKSAEKFGAKVIAVGDSNQFEAIASGDCFRKFIEIAKGKDQLFELNEIRRQKQEWMKEASIEFSGLNTIEGLTRYENHGNIKEYEHKEDVIKEAALSYIGKEKIGTTAVLCYKKNTCNEVNIEIRNLKKEEGTISSEIITTINGKEYAENDKIIFLQNDKKLNIKNGMTGIILGGNEDILKIKTEDNRDIEINTNKYDKIDYGYAITLHKSQGKTYDNVTIVAEKMMDAKATYVAMTRHRENVEMLYSKEEFSSFKMLTNEISKIKQKDLIVDYQNIQNENKTRVFEYQDSLMETSKILKDINQEQGDWKEYREIKNYSIELGKEIYKDYENHKLYLDQIGITKEKLEIRLGIKNRPLSSVEINARDRVKLYAKTSEETRYLFKTMRKETFDITKHEKYGIYTDIREIRNDLAKEILANYPLHRTFISEFSREYYISKKTMENQISYEENVLNKNIEKSDTKTQGSIYSINAINEIKNIIDQNKNERLLKFDLMEILRGNLKSDFKLKYVLDDEGLGKYISKCTTSAFALVCRIETDEGKRNNITKYANAILENSQKDKEYNEQLNSFTVKTVLKQAACFDALMSINNNHKLTKEEINELFMKAQIISNQLNEKEIHLLNNEKVLSELNDVKIVKTNLIENESIKNISDKLYQVIYPD